MLPAGLCSSLLPSRSQSSPGRTVFTGAALWLPNSFLVASASVVQWPVWSPERGNACVTVIWPLGLFQWPIIQNDTEKMIHYLAGSLPLPKKNLWRWPQDLVGMRLLSGPRDYHYHTVVWSWVGVWCAHVRTCVWGVAVSVACLSLISRHGCFFEIVSHQTWNSLIVPGCLDQWASEVYYLPSCQPGLGCRYPAPCSAFFMSTRAFKPRSHGLPAKHFIGWAVSPAQSGNTQHREFRRDNGNDMRWWEILGVRWAMPALVG